jgi:hypothetical protein
MIVLHHLTQDIKCIRSGKMGVGVIDKRSKLDGPMGAQYSLKCHFQLNVVLIDILVEFFRSESLRDLFELVIVIIAFKEWLLFEYHACHHHPQRPDVQRVVVVLIRH